MSRLYEKMEDHAKQAPKNKAFTYRDLEQYESIDYATLLSYVDSLSDQLSAYRDQTVAIIGNNKLEYAVSLLAVLCNVGNVFLIEKELRREDILKIFGQVKPDLIILDEELNFCFEGYATVQFCDIKRMMKEERHFLPRDPAFAGHLILHTSGTTGEPKIVMLSEEQYYGVIPELNQKWEVRSEHSCLLIIPLYHIYALTSLFHGLYAGINNILEWDYKRLGTVLSETKPHLFMGVPLMYHRIMEAALQKAGRKLWVAIGISNLLLRFGIDVRKKWFHGIWEYFGGNFVFGVSAGSPLPQETGKFFHDVGLPVYNVYGMTETSGPVAISYKDHVRYDCVGEILRVNKVKIESPDARGVGHVCICGSNVFEGYLGEGTSANFDGEYFDTGDLGYVKDQYLYVVGRANGILIGANGKNISSKELMQRLMECKEIRDCKVIMENDRLIAIVNTDLEEEELQKVLERVNRLLPRYKRISEVRIVEKRIK